MTTLSGMTAMGELFPPVNDGYCVTVCHSEVSFDHVCQG